MSSLFGQALPASRDQRRRVSSLSHSISLWHCHLWRAVASSNMCSVLVCGVVRAWNLKSHQAVSLPTVWMRISIRVLKIDMKRYRQALAVNDS